MKKYITVLFLFILTTIAQLPALSITPTSWNLGSITSNSGIQTILLEVHNNTSNNIKIDFISTCNCLISNTETLNLSPNTSSAISLSFDPGDENGTVSKFMIIRTTQPGLQKALFEVYGEVAGNNEESQNSNSELKSNTVNTTNYPSMTYSEAIVLKYYYSPGCESCQYFLKTTIPEMEKKLEINIEIDSLDIMNSKVYEEYISILTADEKKEISFPSLLIGDILLQGDKEISDSLKQAVIDYTGTDNRTSSKGTIGAVSISLIPVFLAGLLDGINPCVFSTLLFLISSLTLAGKKRKEILLIGIFFTIAVFITYYLVGLGLFQGLRSASMFPLIADIIKWILIFFLLLISMLSFYDFVQIKQGRAAKISLQLPKFLKLKIHGVIRKQSKFSSIIIGSFILGVMVSVFELACTGQIYFPTIAYLVKLGQISAYFYLLIYNISFIIPLFVVFILIYKGTGSKVITSFFQNNMGVMKISLCLLFLILAGVVFWI